MIIGQVIWEYTDGLNCNKKPETITETITKVIKAKPIKQKIDDYKCYKITSERTISGKEYCLCERIHVNRGYSFTLPCYKLPKRVIK